MAMDLLLVLVGNFTVELGEVHAVFPARSDEVFDPPKNPRIQGLGHVGGVGDEDHHGHVVPPQELNERLHHVALEPVKDEDGSFVVGSEPFSQPGSLSDHLGEENITEPLPKNLIVDE